MKQDLNFFAPLHTPPAKPNPLYLLSGVLAVVAAAAMILFAIYLMADNANKKSEVSQLTARMNDAAYQKQLQAVSDLELETTVIQLDRQLFLNLGGLFTREHRINQHFLNLLKKSLPKDVSITDLKVHDTKIEISGISNNRLGIAKFEEILRKTDKFNHLLVSEISAKESEQNGLNVTPATTEKTYEFHIKIEIMKEAVFDEQTE